MQKNKALLLRLDESLFSALANHRVDTGVPVSEFVRRAIRLALYGDGLAQKACSQLEAGL